MKRPRVVRTKLSLGLAFLEFPEFERNSAKLSFQFPKKAGIAKKSI
jgi:hypothetical protein